MFLFQTFVFSTFVSDEVDPAERITSSADVPPQQQTMPRAEAEKHRLALMEV